MNLFKQISKLYLYNNEHALALSHHNAHVRIFSDFSRGWGIGEETFEYWSWMARQYVLFLHDRWSTLSTCLKGTEFSQSYLNKEHDQLSQFPHTNLLLLLLVTWLFQCLKSRLPMHEGQYLRHLLRSQFDYWESIRATRYSIQASIIIWQQSVRSSDGRGSWQLLRWK